MSKSIMSMAGGTGIYSDSKCARELQEARPAAFSACPRGEHWIHI